MPATPRDVPGIARPVIPAPISTPATGDRPAAGRLADAVATADARPAAAAPRR